MADERRSIPDFKVADLEVLYTQGYECDRRIFAEMRTNLQLVAGEHYVREGSKFWNRIRDDKQLNAEQRLKLTKNHIQRVTKIYRNELESAAPDVAIVAANQKELSDQKAAELNYAYWQYIKACENVAAKKATWIKNFVDIGEVWVKVFWDAAGGQVIGYKPEMVEDPNAPGELTMLLDGMGNPVASKEPAYGGKIRYETFEGYNVRRDPNARSIDESPYIIFSKLISKNALKITVSEEMRKKINDAPTDEWSIYDNNTGMYRVATDQVLVKECYWRPAPEIPNGYYKIWTSQFVIAEGELPFGIWPIVNEGFDEQTGNPRCHSIIRHIRPAQVEINRCASKIAEHQITVGDDKVWVPANSKVGQGALLPGVRVATYTGVQPIVTPGRSGDQYLEYLESQINELYALANLKELVEDEPQTTDPFARLYQSYRFRKKFAIYGEKFERFITKLVETSLRIARKSCSEQELVPAFGKSEYINIAEFKNSEDLHYRIKIEARTEDYETQYGKQIALNHIIQYVGPSLDKEDIGQMLRLSPYLNEEKMFQKLTQKYDTVVNDMLAMDRGMPRPIRPYDDHDYRIQALTARMSQSDFEFLPPEAQMLYQQALMGHEQMKAKQLQDIERAQAGFIPSGGYMVTCDLYVPTPTPGDPNKTARVKIPAESLTWLIKKLQQQGTAMATLMEAPQGAVADIARMMPGAAMQGNEYAA